MDYPGAPQKPDLAISHGCIRWDAWYGNNAAYASISTAACFNTISPVNYRSQAPAHLDQTTNPVSWADTQATFDAEINAAANGGLDYWAYLRYPLSSGSNLNAGYNYHLASSIGNRIGIVMIRQATDLGTTGNFAAQVADCVSIMQGSRYFLQDGRPLMYLYIDTTTIADYWSGSAANLAAAVASIRSSAIGAGLLNPWIVSIGPGAARTTPSVYGADAASNYISSIIAGTPSTYEAFMNQASADWSTYTNQMVPITMVGWDQRARAQNPEPWAIGTVASKYTTTPTISQFAAHLMQARAYIRANPVRCPLRTVLTYAWNECDEGGVMPCPTVGDPTGSLCKAFGMAKRAIF